MIDGQYKWVDLNYQFVGDPLGNSTLVDNRWLDADPRYQQTTDTGRVSSLLAMVGVNLPLYRKGPWSTGLKLHVGLSENTSLYQAIGFEGLSLHFPEYVYVRYSGTEWLDFTLVGGVHYMYWFLPYTMPVVGLEYTFLENYSIRGFMSVRPDTYYLAYSDGTLVPAVQFAERGLSLIYTYSYSKRRKKRRR
ncbi:MAG TPA: hypothetical protein DCR93_17710 [Cytophagales bacterium]|nr:hypothetical protein [Cytophagales bacterium]HAP61248.1 hypothetical protein [Cytophagales bacterium]